MMIRQLAILFGCLALGELLIFFTGIPLPSSTLLLQLRAIRLEWVQTLADFLVANIGFFFVPPGVAIMCHFKLIKAELLPIIVASVVSTVLVLAVTGWVHQLYGKATHSDFEEEEEGGAQ